MGRLDRDKVAEWLKECTPLFSRKHFRLVALALIAVSAVAGFVLLRSVGHIVLLVVPAALAAILIWCITLYAKSDIYCNWLCFGLQNAYFLLLGLVMGSVGLCRLFSVTAVWAETAICLGWLAAVGGVCGWNIRTLFSQIKTPHWKVFFWVNTGSFYIGYFVSLLYWFAAGFIYTGESRAELFLIRMAALFLMMAWESGTKTMPLLKAFLSIRHPDREAIILHLEKTCYPYEYRIRRKFKRRSRRS